MTHRYRLPRKNQGGPLLNTSWVVTDATTPFKDNDQILEGAYQVFTARGDLSENQRQFDEGTPDKSDTRKSAVRRLERAWWQRFAATPDTVVLARVCREARLNRMETEIVMALLLHAYGLWRHSITSAGEVLGVLCLTPAQSMQALRALSEAGRLCKKALLYYDDPDEDLRERSISISEDLAYRVLHNGESGRGSRELRREEDLQTFLPRLTGVMRKKSDALMGMMRGYGNSQEFQKWRMKQNALMHSLDDALGTHPGWKLSRARKAFPDNGDDWCVILALMGKALNHIHPDDDLFSGAGLCRAVCIVPELYNSQLERLLSQAPLVRGGYIQPCGGGEGVFSENAGSVQSVEFELTPKALKLLSIAQGKTQRDVWDASMRAPRIHLNDLALPESTLSAVTLALDHVRHAPALMDGWGLGEVFPYGRGATLLFHGPPGTGKTATAEAIAFELGRPLLAVDYSRIQNCYVGQTEKNIVKIFHKARQADAVLFWDEADAMFYDRDSAKYNWEVRDVNVLLQEIERFEGVCILATNRKSSLDKAFERRISAKVEFPRPDRVLREELWQKLLPKRLPLAEDVDITRLSEVDLAGGEIKNVILNAARFACGRDEYGKVSAFDFERALALEVQERKAVSRRIGF